jgi:hypothetical protein
MKQGLCNTPGPCQLEGKNMLDFILGCLMMIAIAFVTLFFLSLITVGMVYSGLRLITYIFQRIRPPRLASE